MSKNTSATKIKKPRGGVRFKKGNPGKPVGATNKMTKELKQIILDALDTVSGHDGGVNYLVGQARENPAAFISLIGKVLPMTVNAEVTGADGGALTVIVKKFSDATDNSAE